MRVGLTSCLCFSLCFGASAACDDSPAEERAGSGGSGGAVDAIPERLSAWGLFLGDGSTQEPAEGVIPFQVIAPLFADHASKYRFLRLPPGGKIGYEPDERWRFPDGTVLVKTFSYLKDARDPSLGEQLLETRLLVRAAGLWSVHTYAWDEAFHDGVRTIAGGKIAAHYTDAAGVEQSIDYRLPNTNQCLDCHGGAQLGATEALGPRTRQLDRTSDFGAGEENQLDHLESLGLFDVPLPPAAERVALSEPFGGDDLPRRARSYLEGNCAHCHRAGGAAGSSGLFLGIEQTELATLGVCKNPFSAGDGTGGLLYDIVPGLPDQSILLFRMRSLEPNIKMPELPSQLADLEGADLISAWIVGMTPAGCP